MVGRSVRFTEGSLAAKRGVIKTELTYARNGTPELTPRPESLGSHEALRLSVDRHASIA